MGLFDFLAPDRSVSELIPILRYEADMFVMKNGYMDIIQIRTKDLSTMSDDDLNYDIMNLTKFFKTYSADVKLIAMNFPTDTHKQCAYVERRIAQTGNEIYKKHLLDKLAQLQVIHKKATDREYYMMLFSDTPERLRESFAIASKSLGSSNLIHHIDREKKEHILHQLSNKNAALSQ